MANDHGKKVAIQPDRRVETTPAVAGYGGVSAEVVGLLETGQRNAARSVIAALTTTYWHIGRRIVEEERRGQGWAEYGKSVLERLSSDLTRRLGRGFSDSNSDAMRLFYLGWKISQTASGKFEDTGYPGPSSSPNSRKLADSSSAVPTNN